MKVDPTRAPASGAKGLHTRHLSVAGGLRQFGAYVDRLDPGAFSSFRHWHEAEDEMIYVLRGTLTLRDDAGMQDLRPGDAVAWPYGVANGHHLTNRGVEPCDYVIVGSRVAGDICHYPDEGHRQINGATTWQVVAADGQILRQGDLPEELLNLPQNWGKPYAGPTPPGILRDEALAWQTARDYRHPILGGGLGDYRYRLLGDPGGLSQFGAHVEELPPGARSSFRHWHEAEDEFVYLLSGHLVLIEDAETPLAPGDCAAWPAGHPVGHCLENRSALPARYLVIGTRRQADIIHYPDHDLITHKDGPLRRYTHADGSPRTTGETP
jgi:uncharacterized cupin superfamily protein